MGGTLLIKGYKQHTLDWKAENDMPLVRQRKALLNGWQKQHVFDLVK